MVGEARLPSNLTVVETEKMAASRTKNRIKTARWDRGAAIFAYAILATVVLLKLEGIAIEIVAPIAVVGLSLVWFIGWKRGKELYSRIYEEELENVRESMQKRGLFPSAPTVLTRRETEILSYIAEGLGNKQIASELGLSEQTVKNHLSSILRKLDVSDRTQAVLIAINNGWVTINKKEQE